MIKVSRQAQIGTVRKGLIDHGATHPVRRTQPRDDPGSWKDVAVELADKSLSVMPFTPYGTVIGEDDVQAIELQCTISTDCNAKVQVWHPVHGKFDVDQSQETMDILEDVTLKLIEDLEELQRSKVNAAAVTQHDDMPE